MSHRWWSCLLSAAFRSTDFMFSQMWDARVFPFSNPSSQNQHFKQTSFFGSDQPLKNSAFSFFTPKWPLSLEFAPKGLCSSVFQWLRRGDRATKASIFLKSQGNPLKTFIVFPPNKNIRQIGISRKSFLKTYRFFCTPSNPLSRPSSPTRKFEIGSI